MTSVSVQSIPLCNVERGLGAGSMLSQSCRVVGGLGEILPVWQNLLIYAKRAGADHQPRMRHFVCHGFSRTGLVLAETMAWLLYAYFLVSSGFVVALVRANQGSWIAMLTCAPLQEKLSWLCGFSLQS